MLHGSDSRLCIWLSYLITKSFVALNCGCCFVCTLYAHLGTIKLSITADDNIVELYVDGDAKAFQPGGWGTVRVVDIVGDARVIAVKATDTAGVSCFVHFVMRLVKM